MLSFTVSTLRIARAPEVSRVSAAQSCGCPVEGVGGGVQELELAVVERSPLDGGAPPEALTMLGTDSAAPSIPCRPESTVETSL